MCVYRRVIEVDPPHFMAAQARSSLDAEWSALCHTEPLLLTGSLQAVVVRILSNWSIGWWNLKPLMVGFNRHFNNKQETHRKNGHKRTRSRPQVYPASVYSADSEGAAWISSPDRPFRCAGAKRGGSWVGWVMDVFGIMASMDKSWIYDTSNASRFFPCNMPFIFSYVYSDADAHKDIEFLQITVSKYDIFINIIVYTCKILCFQHLQKPPSSVRCKILRP